MKISSSLMAGCLLGLLTLAPVAPGSVDGEIHNVIGCEIIGMNKRTLRKFPGQICLFTDDGNVLSGQNGDLVLYNSSNEVLWSKPIWPHHQINLSLDRKHFLIIGSEITADLARSDVLYIFNRQGKIEKSFNLNSNRSQFNPRSWSAAVKRRFPVIWDRAQYKSAKWEVTHVNSFYEIPDNKLAKKFPAFQKGNYIANDISLMLAFVLSSDLKKVLWQSPITTQAWSMLHDVQVLENGNLFLYDNGTKDEPWSKLMEFDLVSKTTVWAYSRDPRTSFYSARWGGIQLLKNGNILFSDITTGRRSIEIDRAGREVWSMESPSGIYLQQIKRLDLTAFLSRNGGL